MKLMQETRDWVRESNKMMQKKGLQFLNITEFLWYCYTNTIFSIQDEAETISFLYTDLLEGLYIFDVHMVYKLSADNTHPMKKIVFLAFTPEILKQNGLND